MSTEIICVIITSLTAITTAIIGRKSIKNQEQQKKREERRREESLLNLDMTVAAMDLTEVCANALTGGHNNGNVEEARKKVLSCREKYKEFQRKVISEEI